MAVTTFPPQRGVATSTCQTTRPSKSVAALPGLGARARPPVIATTTPLQRSSWLGRGQVRGAGCEDSRAAHPWTWLLRSHELETTVLYADALH